MNNNRGNNNNGNNRRRGRGNNRPQGGGQPANRIDSRARGNAPQMLEKYRKLAHDAHLNGDRVQAEYFLQFADHYFRVIADTRVRQEEQRARRDERWQEGDAPQTETDDSADFSVESDFPTFDQPPTYSRREREDRPERGERQERSERQERPERAERPARPPRREEPRGEPEPAGEEAEAPAATNPYEPADNPFIRPNRNARGLRPRREDRQPRRDEAAEGVPASAAAESEPLGLDPASLPPAIAREDVSVEEVVEAKPRRRTRRKATDEGDAETVASVG